MSFVYQEKVNNMLECNFCVKVLLFHELALNVPMYNICLTYMNDHDLCVNVLLFHELALNVPMYNICMTYLNDHDVCVNVLHSHELSLHISTNISFIIMMKNHVTKCSLTQWKIYHVWN